MMERDKSVKRKMKGPGQLCPEPVDSSDNYFLRGSVCDAPNRIKPCTEVFQGNGVIIRVVEL